MYLFVGSFFSGDAVLVMLKATSVSFEQGEGPDCRFF